MTDPRQHDLPEGLVDVPRCLAEAGKLRSRSWNDPAIRRTGRRFLAVHFAVLGFAVLATLAAMQVKKPGGVEVADSQVQAAAAQDRSGIR